MVICVSSSGSGKQAWIACLRNTKPPYGGVCFLLIRGDKGNRTPDLVTASHTL